MAINKNHLFEDLDGIKCAVVEAGVSESRKDFLKSLLEANGFTVVVVIEAAKVAAVATAPVKSAQVAAAVVVTPAETPPAAVAAAVPPAATGAAAAAPVNPTQAAVAAATAVGDSKDDKPASQEKVVPATAAAAGESTEPKTAAATATATIPAISTYKIGVTDVTFNATNAIFGRLLRTRDGHVVTLAYWQQKESKARDDVPYFSTGGSS